MMRTCFGLAITTFFTCGRDNRRDRRGVAGRLDDDDVVLDKLAAKALSRSRRMSTRPSRLSLPSSHATASAKARWISSPMMRMPAPSILARSKRELAGNTTSTDPRSQRIRESRKGRPCNELGLSAHGLSAACPHLRAPGAPRPGWAHHKAVLRREQPDRKAPQIIIPDNGIVERFHKTVLDEFYRVAFRKRIYGSIAELQADLDEWIRSYNEDRPHQGRWCFGKTPMQTFLDAVPLAKEKMIAA